MRSMSNPVDKFKEYDRNPERTAQEIYEHLKKVDKVARAQVKERHKRKRCQQA